MFVSRINDYVQHLVRSEYSENTIKKYTLALRKFIEFSTDTCNNGDIYKEHFIRYKEHLKQKYAPNTTNLYLVALNKYLVYIGEADLCVKTLKLQSNNSLENCLSVSEYRAMLEVAKRRKNNAIYYIIRTLASTGCRFKELEYFNLENVRKGRVTVTNKGKTRVIVVPEGLGKELIDYCASRDIVSGYMFHARIKDKPISEATVWRWLHSVAEAAGVDTIKAFPHNLRHLFAIVYMGKYNDLAELADILGHTKIDTTRIYTRTSADKKRSKIEELNL